MRIKSFIISILVLASCSTPPGPPASSPSPSPAPQKGFVVSAERKNASLIEIRALVDKLNGIIDRKAFSEWLTYLDDAYLKTYSDPQRLKDYSATSPFLKQYGIKLNNLEDYFRFVVAPSRAKVV